MIELFKSRQQLTGQFQQGLEQMLQHEGLGVFILVFANAVMSPSLYRSLQQPLYEKYQQLESLYRSLLHDGRKLPDNDDDVMVFLKMLTVGYQQIRIVEQKYQDQWELQFNQVRGFRPPRGSNLTTISNHVAFDDNGFHFNKTFLRKETLWQGMIEGRQIDLLYNKFPFIENHMLLVPDREHNIPQYLTESDHCYIWDLSSNITTQVDGWGVGYNSYGAYSSVNHLHFQAFARDKALPIEDPCWQHNGGNKPYPVLTHCFDDSDKAWNKINDLNQSAKFYNLLYRPHRLYIIERKCQSDYQHADWTGGYAWYEVCGGLVTFNQDDYQRLTIMDLQAELQLLSVI
jgi:hypothetical protein